MELGLLIIRLAAGLTLAAHGGQKLFGWFGGYGLTGTGSFFEKLGFRPGRLQAALAGGAEMGGGLLLAAGLFTPIAAAAVIAVMLVAVASVHWNKGFFASNGGYEYPFILAALALGISFTGPGASSLDSALGIDWSGISWGSAALVVGLLMGGVPLVLRRADPAAAQKAA